MCTRRMHVAGTVSKLVHTKLMLVNFHVVEETVCKAEKLRFKKLRPFLSCFITLEFKPAELLATCCGEKMALKEI